MKQFASDGGERGIQCFGNLTSSFIFNGHFSHTVSQRTNCRQTQTDHHYQYQSPNDPQNRTSFITYSISFITQIQSDLSSQNHICSTTHETMKRKSNLLSTYMKQHSSHMKQLYSFKDHFSQLLFSYA